MNRTIRVRRAVALSCALVLAAAGCELAVDFDRTKIDAGSIDASIADVVATDSPTPRDSGPDVAVDAPPDAPIDAPLDALGDVTTDANTPDVDAGTDAAADAAADAPDDADDSG